MSDPAELRMFENGLARGREIGTEQERERIINQIEGLTYTDEQGHEMISEFKSDLIALIKGEQK